MPLLLKVLILALIQGVCELLPVSSSAHVVISEKLMGLDPTGSGDDAAACHAAHRHDAGRYRVFLERLAAALFCHARAYLSRPPRRSSLPPWLTVVIGFAVMKIAVRLLLGPNGEWRACSATCT